MSFDLFILVGKIEKTTQIRWIKKLKDKGIDCQFPDGFVINENFVGEISVKCQFNPPLVKQKTKIEECEFYFEPIPIDSEFLQDVLESTADKQLQQKIAQMKYELSIRCSAETMQNSIILTCYVAATLAEASTGILFDPQEFGAVIGEKIYHVARYHSDVDYQNDNKEVNIENKSNIVKSEQNKKSKGMSATMIVLLFLLFMALRHILTN